MKYKSKALEEKCRLQSENMKGEGNPMYGRKHSWWTKRKMSKMRKGVGHPNKYKGKSYEEIYGIKKANEIKKKMSLKRNERKISKKTRKLISQSKLGKPSPYKDKTYEEIFGKEKADEITKKKKDFWKTDKGIKMLRKRKLIYKLFYKFVK